MITNCMFFSVTVDRDQWEALCKPSRPGNGGGRQGDLVPVWDGQWSGHTHCPFSCWNLHIQGAAMSITTIIYGIIFTIRCNRI